MAIFLLANILINTGLRSFLVPGIAAIVALHFVPMAWAIPFRSFYALAAALLIVAVLGMAAGPLYGPPPIAGVGAALALWTASLAAIRRT